VLQHVAPEGPGTIEVALRDRNISIDVVHIHTGEPVPGSVAPWKGLVVMGGPMGVYEEATYPHLRAEIRLIRAALREGLPILGVCLGSQLLAAALGARVAPGTREIGFYPVELSPEASRDPLWAGVASPFTPFHWHGDAFDVPPGCVGLARSERTACQAFSHGEHSYGLLFHLEVTEPMVRAMTDAFAGELASAGVDRDLLHGQAFRELPSTRGIAATVFGRWADRIDRTGR
jgi:GMP synthase-like glutamine amidotransferase